MWMARTGTHAATPALVLCGAQALTAILASIVVLAVSGIEAGMAALFGGLVIVAPGVYFAAQVHLRAKAVSAGEALGVFYRAETRKLILVALGFWIGASWFGQHFAPLMLTAMACLAVNGLLLAVTRSN
jgi:F0F1-type ATP synthase assembly protein I